MKFSWILLFATMLFHAGRAAAQSENGSLSKWSADLKVSTLGPGAEVSTAIMRRANLRAGVNFFTYGLDQTKDGVTYGGELHLASSEAHFDWFPFGGSFHLSPGLLVYNGNHANATASVPGGKSFTLNNTTYISSPISPVAGTATLALNANKVSPAVLFGWGNLLPRGKGHFLYNVEAGVVFMGSPNAVLNLGGATCNSNGTNCQNISANAKVQSDIQAQQTKINNDLSFFKYYPVISVAFGYKF